MQVYANFSSVFPQGSLASCGPVHNVGMIFVDEHYFRDDITQYLLLPQCCSGHVHQVYQDIVAFCFALRTGGKSCCAVQTCLCVHEHKLFSVWLCCM